ncbi:MAG: hypothetical protein A3F10_03465 [Coxiella sp. RIFCSPHIGHO2_12_FULL_42_15]|nr:MAG: hypothetical protein A3F10_03465 [Coxiella sp. RIFCSPHIGHO2_12_FULL_42_15]
MKNTPTKIIISRTDNIGDVVLTLPLAALLKQKFPNVHITFLTRDYARAIVENCPDVDAFLSWNTLSTASKKEAKNILQQGRYDTIVHVFPQKPIAKLAKRANIKNRIGTTRRWYHFLTCNQRVRFSRAQSQRHEAQLNLHLLAPLGIPENYDISELTPLIRFTPQQLTPELQRYLHPQKFNLIIHPLSNGHGREWPLSYFEALIKTLPLEKFHLIISGSQKEKIPLQPLLQACPQLTDVIGQLNLNQLLQLMAHCDGLIANSTGPLHMAAGTGINVLGLYPPASGMNPQRWQPLGKQARYLVAKENCALVCNNNNCSCIRDISVQQVKKILLGWHKNATSYASI